MSSPLPAAHSPGTAPDAVSAFAAVIASRKVHKPSELLVTSEVLLTVIVLAGVIALLTVEGAVANASAGRSAVPAAARRERFTLIRAKNRAMQIGMKSKRRGRVGKKAV